MKQWFQQNAKLLLLSLGHMVTDLNQGAIALVAVYLKDKFDLTYFMVGIIILVANVSSSVIQPLFGAISDRYNTLWLMPAGTLVAGAGLAFSGIAPTYSLALLGVFICGLGVSAFHPEGSKAARRVGGERKASAMSIFSVGGNLGFGLGPLLAGVLYKFWGLTGLLGFLLPVLATVFLLVRSLPAYREPVVNKGLISEKGAELGQQVPSVRGPLSTLTGIVIIRSWVQAGLATYIPLYVIDVLQGSKDQGAYVLALFLMAGAIGTLFGGAIADRFGPRKLIFLSMLLMAPLIWLFPYTRGIWMEFTLFVAGAILVSTFSTTIVLGQEMLPNHLGTVSGLMIGFAIGMGGVGVTIFGEVADRVGILPVLQGIAFLPLLGAALTLLLVYGWRTKGVKPQQQG